MRILRRKTKKRTTPKTQLFLKINANRAADLVPTEVAASHSAGTAPLSTSSKKSVNPVLVASLNGYKRKTVRKLHTSQPSWDDSVHLPLKQNDYSQLLVLTIWDKHRRYKNYMGELRLSVSDIFTNSSNSFSLTSDLKWYKLYSGQSYQGFVTGSLLLSFELVVKTKRRKKSTGVGNKTTIVNKSKDTGAVPTVLINPPTAHDLYTKIDDLNLDAMEENELVPVNTLSEGEKSILLQAWLDSLLVSSPDRTLLSPNEQGFYPDGPTIMADGSDLESVTPSLEPTSESGSAPIPILKATGDISHDNLLHPDDISGSDYSICTDDSAAESDDASQFLDSGDVSLSQLLLPFLVQLLNLLNPQDIPSTKKKHPLLKLRLKASQNSHFEVSNRDVLGVIFLEIVSCSDLPPLSNITRTSFDMDPFVVVTFGKRTFRTSWKRHTLNPIFNERLAFEILAHEHNFNIQFSVLDKDSFSFHDEVADVTVRMKEITDMSTETSFAEADGADGTDSAAMEGETVSGFSMGLPVLDPVDYPSLTSIRLSEDANMVSSIKKKRFTKRKKVTVKYEDTSKFKTMDLALNIHKEKYLGKYKPTLKIRARFEPYESLRRQFWKVLLEQYLLGNEGKYDYIELIALLDTLGCENSDDIVSGFFESVGKLAWGGDTLTIEEISDMLEKHVTSNAGQGNKIFQIEKCPICCQKRLSKKQDVDIITHVAICASKDWSIVNKLLLLSYDTPQVATRRWFSKVLIKLTYGKYKLGSNSANILVQDRTTGIVMEEKMGVYVRLGIRVLYKGLDSAKKKRIRQLLKSLSIKQGAKFDAEQLKNDIKAFIKFHSLDLSDCLEEDPLKYATFNEFFYRKLKPGARKLSSEDDRVVVSPADCRSTCFDSVDAATELWVKGRNFTLAKLFNGNLENLETTDLFNPSKCSLGIFRLAPQDYHRFHSPVSGVIRSIKHVDGEYYTVNPMAIRSELDVFGENVRSIICIETEHFGTVIMIAVGAMMVGSIVLSVGEQQKILRGEEVGYFKFGGSTILLLFQSLHFKFDSDLVNNSNTCVETLIRVGQSIGHSPEVPECTQDHIDFDKQSKDFKLNLIRVLTGGDLSDTKGISNWEASRLLFDDDDEVLYSGAEEDINDEGLDLENDD